MSASTVERTRPPVQARPADQIHPAGPTRAADQPAVSGSRAARRSGAAPAAKEGRGAVGRAYARRAVRERRLAGEENPSSRRTQFVLLVMVLLGAGLVASLWLSTTAAADSYRLDVARQATRDLTERNEALRIEIASMRSAPALAEAAQRMGMVQVSDPARLVVGPDGSVRLVGVPKAAVAPPPPPPAPAPPAGQPADPAQAPSDPAQAPGNPTPAGQVPGDPAPAGQAPGNPTQSGQVRADPARAGQVASDPARAVQVGQVPADSGQTGQEPVGQLAAPARIGQRANQGAGPVPAGHTGHAQAWGGPPGTGPIPPATAPTATGP
jgi:hypothetical protein